jgi:hypothetical protein
MFPHIALAQGLEDNVASFMSRVYTVIFNPLIVFFFALALALFLLGMLKFLANKSGGNNEKMEEGKSHMLWGIIGMFIMITVFGIMRIIINTLGSDVQI